MHEHHADSGKLIAISDRRNHTGWSAIPFA